MLIPVKMSSTSSAINFSRAVSGYNENAIIQRQTAQILLDLIEKYYFPSDFDDKNILDLGCGTGFLGKEFLLRFQENLSTKYYELDLSSQMLLSWAERPFNFFPICANFDYQLPFKEKTIDLIISSFAIHWIKDLKSFFENVFSLLNNEGRFIFALPTFGSLKELTEVGFFIRDFPSYSQIEAASILAGFDLDYGLTKTYYQSFINFYTAAKSIKLIGANSVAERRSNQIFLRPKRICKNSEVKISWNISFFIVRKK